MAFILCADLMEPVDFLFEYCIGIFPSWREVGIDDDEVLLFKFENGNCDSGL